MKMDEVKSLSADERTLVDTNFFVAIGDPENWKFQQFRDLVDRSGVMLSVPERVEDELSIHPNERRLSAALEEEWAEIVSAPPLTASEAIEATDHARQTIADLTAQDEHDVEKTDTIFAGLAVQYLASGDDRVTVLTDDGPATKAVKSAVKTVDVHGKVRVLTLEEVIGNKNDDINII
jgi:hypothetical protein